MVDQIHLVIRTPREVVFNENVRGIRIPTETGQVGIRPAAEPMLLVVEPGLIVIRKGDGERFAASAGGLFESGCQCCVLYTPFAVTGKQDTDVLAALDRAISTPHSELAARRRLGELEQRIVREIRRPEPIMRGVRP
jgi:F0F1-type ATP synthase epsilon subunit